MFVGTFSLFFGCLPGPGQGGGIPAESAGRPSQIGLWYTIVLLTCKGEIYGTYGIQYTISDKHHSTSAWPYILPRGRWAYQLELLAVPLYSRCTMKQLCSSVISEYNYFIFWMQLETQTKGNINNLFKDIFCTILISTFCCTTPVQPLPSPKTFFFDCSVALQVMRTLQIRTINAKIHHNASCGDCSPGHNPRERASWRGLRTSWRVLRGS